MSTVQQRQRPLARPGAGVVLAAAVALTVAGCGTPSPTASEAPAPPSVSVPTPPPAGSEPAAAPTTAPPAAATPATSPGATDPSGAVPTPGAPTATTPAVPDQAAIVAANQAVQLPGGGRSIFTDSTVPGATSTTQMYVALYGHPSGPALGLLGEQGTAATIARAQEYAARYQPHTKRTVVPALEIIATVASAEAGEDGDYSRETRIVELKPLVDAARAAGVYVVLDLQPGRTDFLTQAKRYAPLLLEPHVGLALDPEWRLKPNQRHLRQIGSVSAEEINQVSQWLNGITAANGLPQKMLLLHQFRLSMIRDRDTLNTSHPNLAFVIQMDGQGSQPAKQDTWRALRTDRPANTKFGWKNFIDEDHPMLTPQQTMEQVHPRPVWVSYQ